MTTQKVLTSADILLTTSDTLRSRCYHLLTTADMDLNVIASGVLTWI